MLNTLSLSDNTTIHYELIEGNSDKPYLIFLHEGLGCNAMWKGFPKQLCEKTGYPGLLYDRSGYGKSSALNSARTIHYLHDYALMELPKVIDSIIPDRPYILIGHSDGGSIALIFGAQRPVLLKGIITEAAHVFVEPEPLEGIRAADKDFELGKFKGLYKYHKEKTRNIFKAWSETWLSEWFSHWNIEYLLPSIECPLLVVQGKNDHYGTESQVDSIVSKSSGPAESYFIENCEHSPHLEKPKILTKRILDFLGELEFVTQPANTDKKD